MTFNSKKIEKMVRAKGIQAKEYFAYVYPGRSGNAYFGSIAGNNNPKADAVERIADLLQCSIDELFDRELPEEQTPETDKGADNDSVLVDTIKNLNNVIAQQNATIVSQNQHINQLLMLLNKTETLN